MRDTSVVSSKSVSLGENVVDGLVFGLLAGSVMGLYLLLVGLFSGESVGAVASRFAVLTGGNSMLTGLGTHLATSSVYGTIFGGIWHVAIRAPFRLPRRPIGALLLGGLFGSGLLLVALALLEPTQSLLLDFAPIHLAVAHLLYGVTIGRFMGRRQLAQ